MSTEQTPQPVPDAALQSAAQRIAQPAVQQQTVTRYRLGQPSHSEHDWLAQEVPVAMVYNGISHAVMMASPSDLEDFGRGFSLAEGIVDHAGQIYDLDIQHTEEGIALHMDIAGAAFDRLKQKRRSLTGRTGCGVCGTESLAMLAQQVPPPVQGAQVSLQAMLQALQALPAQQTINQLTGGLHAAAFADAAGNLLLVREDVGRHNALDKLIGALQSLPVDIRSQGMVLMTSRASYELIVKTCRGGIPTLACVSAPTTLAVQLAKQSGLCLAGFARGQACVVYAHAERVGD